MERSDRKKSIPHTHFDWNYAKPTDIDEVLKKARVSNLNISIDSSVSSSNKCIKGRVLFELFDDITRFLRKFIHFFNVIAVPLKTDKNAINNFLKNDSVAMVFFFFGINFCSSFQGIRFLGSKKNTKLEIMLVLSKITCLLYFLLRVYEEI